MGIEEIKNKLIKRSRENWEKHVKENANVKHGKLRTSYTFKPKFKKKRNLSPVYQKYRYKKMFHSI